MSLLFRIWLFVVVIALTVHLGGFALIDADEGRNAEVAREMAETNDYVMPRLNGLPYLDKPVVYFAAAAAFIEVLGPTEVAARMPAYLFTLATAAVLFWFARRVWGRSADASPETPWVAAIVFLSMPLTIAFSRTVIFDSALTFFAVVGLLAFYLAIEERASRWSVLAWSAMGVAMLTKGPVTFILVLAVALPYAWRRQSVRLLFPLAGIALFTLIIAPWVWGVSQVVPEFVRYIVVTETVERVATPALDRTGPPWYFLPYLIGGALPWSIVAIFSWRRLRRPDPAIAYCLLAIAIPFIFFSLSQSKRPQYILPLLAPLALVVARIWDDARTRSAAVVLLLAAVVFFAAPAIMPYTRLRPELSTVAPSTAIAFGVAFAVGGALALSVRRRDVVLAALTLPMIALPLLANPLMQAIAERRSARGFAEELEPHVGPQTRVIGVEAFTGSLPFYLERRMIVVTEDASELTSNYLVRRYERFVHDPASPLKPLEFFGRSLADCCTPRVYILRTRDRQRRAILEAHGWRVVAEGARHLGFAR